MLGWLELEPRLRRPGSFLVPGDPWHWFLLHLHPTLTDKDRVWQGLWARPREAWECFALTFSPGLAPNRLPGCFSTSHPSSLWTSTAPHSVDKAPGPPALLGVDSAVSDSREKNHIQS